MAEQISLRAPHPAANGAAAPAVIDTTTKDFAKDVIEASKVQPVLVDFWAPWCGPCKTLGPIIEKVVGATKGKVRLVKMNTDDHPQIPGQLGIQSIPAVIAFFQGRAFDGFVGALPESQVKAFIDRVLASAAKGAVRLVKMDIEKYPDIAGQLGIQSIPAVIAFANGQPVDGFVGNLPEGQIKAFIDRLGGPAGPSEVDQILAEAEALLDSGDAPGASELFATVLEAEPGSICNTPL